MLKKAKLYSLLAIIVASTAVSLFSFSENIYAQSSIKWHNDQAVNDDIRANTYAYVAMQCLDMAVNQFPFSPDHDTGKNIGNSTYPGASYPIFLSGGDSSLESGGIFGAYLREGRPDLRVTVGNLVEPNDGVLSCNETGPLILQYTYQDSDVVEMICNLGYRPYSRNEKEFYGGGEKGRSGYSVDDCINAYNTVKSNNDVYAIPLADWESGGKDRAMTALMGARQNKTDNKSDYFGSYGIGAIQYYVMYMSALNQCGTPLAYTSDTNIDTTTKSYPVVPFVNADGSVQDVYFKFNTSKKVSVGTILDGRNQAGDGDGTFSCQEVQDAITKYPQNFKFYVDSYASWLGAGKGTTDLCASDISNPECQSDGTSSSTCRVDGIGWIVCPIMNFLAGMADSAYYLLENSLLKVAPVTTTDDKGQSTSLYESWKIMRNFANIAFIIAFLVIVFSQITNFGVSNYGLKRLLPKLIVAAIMVNLSFYVCALAVDISNILGSQLKALLDSTAKDVAITPEGALGDLSDGGGTSGFVGWTTITTGTLIAVAATGGGMAVLPVLGLLLLAVLGAVLTVVVTLILRQVLIILLIVISPLAFIALLLPNTESYFKKWRTVFQTLLLLYPIISLVFGASALASTIIMGAAEAAPTTSDGADGFFIEGVGGVTQTLLQLTGAAAAVLPLFIVPALMKLAGGVLNRFAGIVNDPSKGLIDKKRNSLKESRQIRKAEGIQRQGEFAASATGNRMLGVGDTRRRRAFGRLTAFGANNRELARKDDLARAGSILEGSYLNTEDGQDVRNASKNAQVRTQNAQTATEAARLQAGSEGAALVQETMSGERQKKTNENAANALAERNLTGTNINRELLQSEKTLHTEQARSQTAAIGSIPHIIEGELLQAEMDKKTAEDQHVAGSAAYVNRASRTAAMIAEKERQEAENRETAAATTGPALTAATNAAKSAANDLQSAQNRVDARAQGSASSRLRLVRSQLSKETADDTATTATTNSLTNSATGQRALGAREDAKNRKQTAENDSKSMGIAMANEEFKVQAETSAEVLSDQQGNDKRLYEEVIAGSVPAGVSAVTAANAQATRKASAITSRATEGAKRVSTKQDTKEILNDPTLATQMAGIDPGGENRVRAGAEAAQAQAEREGLNNSVQLLSYEAIRAGKTLKQYAIEVVDDTIGGTLTPNPQVIEAALEAAAQDGQVSTLRKARMSGNIDQTTLTKVLARNADTMKQKGGFDLQNDPGLAGATPRQMDLSVAKNLGDIAASNIPAVKSGEWKRIAADISRIITEANTDPDALAGLQKSYIALTEALRNPDTRAGLTDRMKESQDIHKALDARFSTAMPNYTIDFTKPPKDW